MSEIDTLRVEHAAMRATLRAVDLTLVALPSVLALTLEDEGLAGGGTLTAARAVERVTGELALIHATVRELLAKGGAK